MYCQCYQRVKLNYVGKNRALYAMLSTSSCAAAGEINNPAPCNIAWHQFLSSPAGNYVAAKKIFFLHPIFV